MSTGILRYWNDARGFGFIRSYDGSPDAFAGMRDMAGTNPQIGSRVEYEGEMSERGPRAKWWRVLD